MMNAKLFVASVEQKEIGLVHLVYLYYLLALCQGNKTTQIKTDESLNLEAFIFQSWKEKLKANKVGSSLV